MHSSGSITRKFGPSWKQSTGHTSTQSVYLHLMQFSVTTKGMEGARVRWRGHFSGLCASCGRLPLQERLQPRDRESVVQGKSVSVRVVVGGRRILIKKAVRPNSLIMYHAAIH